jgi:prolyl-tRNA synthetase
VNVAVGDAAANIVAQLAAMQVALLDKARAMRDANIHRVDTWDEFSAQFSGEGGGGFVLAHWDGTQETEDRISEMTKATIRCIPQVPLDPADETPGTCVLTGAPSARRVIFAKAY